MSTAKKIIDLVSSQDRIQYRLDLQRESLGDLTRWQRSRFEALSVRINLLLDFLNLEVVHHEASTTLEEKT